MSTRRRSGRLNVLSKTHKQWWENQPQAVKNHHVNDLNMEVVDCCLRVPSGIIDLSAVARAFYCWSNVEQLPWCMKMVDCYKRVY